MKEITGDLWEWYSYGNESNVVICITTNGTFKKNGSGVMGRGCAHEALERIPDLDALLGYSLRQHGNVCAYLTPRILAFPVKRNWWEEASILLIQQSAIQLAARAKMNADTSFILPRPGCGNGRLKWEHVKPIIEPILPDNVWVITK